MESTKSEVWLVSPRAPVREILQQLLPVTRTLPRRNFSRAHTAMCVRFCVVCIDIAATFPHKNEQHEPNSPLQVLAEKKSEIHRSYHLDGLAWIGAARRAEVNAPLILVATSSDEIATDLAALTLGGGRDRFSDFRRTFPRRNGARPATRHDAQPHRWRGNRAAMPSIAPSAMPRNNFCAPTGNRSITRYVGRFGNLRRWCHARLFVSIGNSTGSQKSP